MPIRTPDPRLQAFGFAVRTAREKADLSIEALAEAAGLSARMLIGIEHGQRNPSLLTILAISRGLQADPADLVRSAAESQ